MKKLWLNHRNKHLGSLNSPQLSFFQAYVDLRLEKLINKLNTKHPRINKLRGNESDQNKQENIEMNTI